MSDSKHEVTEYEDLPAEITSGIYLGSMGHAREIEILTKCDIHSIVNCAKESPDFFPKKITYLDLNLKDQSDQIITDEILNEVFDFIDQSKSGNVLIHCVVSFGGFELTRFDSCVLV
jgi:hypothetical protein